MSSPSAAGTASTPRDRKRKLSLTRDAASPQSPPILKHTRNTSTVNGPRALDSLVEASAANPNAITQQTSASASSLQEAIAANGDAQMLDSDVNDVTADASDDDDSDLESAASESSSVLESAVYQIELDPYVYDNQDDAYTADEAKQLRARVKEVGLERFVDETMDVSHRKLGTAFGMDPKLPIDEELFTKLLFTAMARHYRKREKLDEYNDIQDAADLILRSKTIMVITGAGISTSLGIPDFRSRTTGFYARLREKGFDDAEQVFDIENFDLDPTTFYTLAGDILPDQSRFTPTHAFIKLLQDKDKLQTNYTQNIDNLEEAAGIDRAKLIQCHGSFATASCRKCRHQVPGEEIFDNIRNGIVAECQNCIEIIKSTGAMPVPPSAASQPPKKLVKKHNNRVFSSSSSDDSAADDDIPTPGIMKPDITFFGEALPQNFFQRFTSIDANPEVSSLDLVVVIGTSLSVAPVSEMVNYVPASVPQIYISREPAKDRGFDVQLLGECDVICWELARRVGWALPHEMIPTGGYEVHAKEWEENSKDKGWWKVEGVKVENSSQQEKKEDLRGEEADAKDPFYTGPLPSGSSIPEEISAEQMNAPRYRQGAPKTDESVMEIAALDVKAPVYNGSLYSGANNLGPARAHGPSTGDSNPEEISSAAFAAAGGEVLAPILSQDEGEDIKVKMEAVAEGSA